MYLEATKTIGENTYVADLDTSTGTVNMSLQGNSNSTNACWDGSYISEGPDFDLEDCCSELYDDLSAQLENLLKENPPQTLAELHERMQAGIYNGDWQDLPTFGGPEPANTEEVWSWNETHIIIGPCADSIVIEYRPATNTEITQLMAAAGAAGDTECVEMCKEALAGCDSSREDCTSHLRQAQLED